MSRSEGISISRSAYIPACFYAVASLSAMAGMSVGVGVALLLILGFMVFSSKFATAWRQACVALLALREVAVLQALTILLVTTLILSLVFGTWFPVTFGGEGVLIRLGHDSLKLAYFVLPWIWASTLSLLESAHRRQFFKLWTGVAGGLGVLAVVQFFTGFPHEQPIPTSPEYFHATLLFGHHLSTASILIFPFFVALGLGFEGADRNYYRPLALLAGVALILSFSRMVWIALPISIFVFGMRYVPKRRRVQLALGGAAAIALLLPLALKNPSISERVRNPMGISTRVELWKLNLDYFRMRPVLGVGWRKSESLTHAWARASIPDAEARKAFFVGHAHNNLLEMLAGTGLLGALSWLAWNCCVLVIAWRASRGAGESQGVAWGIFCAFLALHLNGLTQVNFWEGKVMHQWTFALGILLSITPLARMKTT
jgi:O-antigen ligase